MDIYLGFDPGRDKCGMAIVDSQGKVYEHCVVLSPEAIACLGELQSRYHLARVIMGNQTTAKTWQKQLQTSLYPALEVVLVDERNSSLEARERYWEMYPPRGLQRLIPQGMRIPPVPIDDIVAILLVERYLTQLKQSNLE
jgi:RNase H-fold protein (predicted Holliday junction resolvase)